MASAFINNNNNDDAKLPEKLKSTLSELIEIAQDMLERDDDGSHADQQHYAKYERFVAVAQAVEGWL